MTSTKAKLRLRAGIPNQADARELTRFSRRAPDTRMLEVIIPDINGILRGKRIPMAEATELFHDGIKACGSITLLSSKGETFPELGLGSTDGDPDNMVLPVRDTLAPVPWLESKTAQVLVGMTTIAGAPSLYDPRNVLRLAMQPLLDMGLRVVVATELEFYLLQPSESLTPMPQFPRVPGTGIRQDGLQYSMTEDLWDCDAFIDDVHRTCAAQNLPSTATHSEFSPGQIEINLHHVADPILACDHAVLLKRVIKGVARRHGYGATFMAKPFEEHAGSGLHIHISVYDRHGRNVLAAGGRGTPPLGPGMRHAIGGLAATMAECMAIFAPNANSYRRLKPKSFVPLNPDWGYNHRGVALRIPVSDAKNLRIEHRVAGADANPYLVMAAILMGIHHGLTNRCEPGPMVQQGTFLEDRKVTLPTRWDAALGLFDRSTLLPRYLDREFCRIFSVCRHSESNQFHAQISNRDYEWYLRAV
jgi:glutamine synthetase